MPTKAQLQAELEALRHNYDRLESKVVRLEEAHDALQRQLTVAIAQRNEQLDAKHDALNAAADARKHALKVALIERAKASIGVVQRIRSEYA